MPELRGLDIVPGEASLSSARGEYLDAMNRETIIRNASFLRTLFAGLLLSVLAGCGSMSDIKLQIDPGAIAARPGDSQRRALVEVIDIRKQARLERTTIGDVSMGRVALDPPEAELIREMVSVQADALLAQSPATQTPPWIQCGIRIFDIVTPATALYWDVTTRIEIVLRVSGQERSARGSSVERTYAWPSGEIIQRTTHEALRQVARESAEALRELLSASAR